MALIGVSRSVWWDIARWRQSTAYMDLSLAEQGAYRNLIDDVWLRPDGIIPDDSLARASGDPKAWPKLAARVLRWMQKVPGGWTNDVAVEVKRKSIEYRAEQQARGRARANGPRGGDGRLLAQPKVQPGVQPERHPEVQPTPHPETQPRVHPEVQPLDSGMGLKKEDPDPERGLGLLKGPPAPETEGGERSGLATLQTPVPKPPDLLTESNPFATAVAPAIRTPKGPGISDLTPEELERRRADVVRTLMGWKPSTAAAEQRAATA